MREEAGPHAQGIIADPIEDALLTLQNPATTHLDLTGGKTFTLEDEDVAELVGSDVWRRNCTLTSLDLSLNNITDEGALALAAAISAHPSAIAALDLDCNMIGDAGAIALIRALPATARRLDLSGNLITDAALAAFVEHMTSEACRCRDLHTLTIRDCPRLTDAGCEGLLWWLAEAEPALRSLTLSGNAFTDAVLPALKYALQINTTLLDVNVSNTHIADFSPLVEVFEKNTTLIALTMGNDGKRVTFPKIDAALRQNKRRHAARRGEVELLREEHARRIAELTTDHRLEVQRLREEIEELRAALREARGDAGSADK